ncbi:unnamed protein product [Calypogeia fissa]
MRTSARLLFHFTSSFGRSSRRRSGTIHRALSRACPYYGRNNYSGGARRMAAEHDQSRSELLLSESPHGPLASQILAPDSLPPPPAAAAAALAAPLDVVGGGAASAVAAAALASPSEVCAGGDGGIGASSAVAAALPAPVETGGGGDGGSGASSAVAAALASPLGVRDGGDGGGSSHAAAGGGGGERVHEGEWFRVSDSVKLVLHLGDITTWSVDGQTDAIVNAANSRMLGGGGVDGAIHRKAGPKLLAACKEVPQVDRGIRCPVGEARVTPGFNLPASKVIHTVGPVYFEYDDPSGLLANAYRNSLKAAIENGIKYIAFPAISCGVYCYPCDEAATVSLSVIKEASNGLSEVHFVLFNQESFSAWMEEASNQFERVV